jgi:hypothetical protein
MLNRLARISLTFAAAAAIAAAPISTHAARAQQPQPASPQKTTITGCVERADQVISRETLGTSVDSQTFVLVKTDASAKTPAASRAPVGTAGTAAEPAAQQTIVRLEGADDSLNTHVGHMVEVTGQLTPAAQQPSVANPTLGGSVKVDSVRVLAETCKQP